MMDWLLERFSQFSDRAASCEFTKSFVLGCAIGCFIIIVFGVH
jgi:hypothetical protein